MTSKKKQGESGQVNEAAVLSPYSPASVRQFWQEVAAEFSKIVWPDRKVTFGLSGFVILLTVLLSIYLGTADFILGRLVSLVLG
jgi:preprotein translocase subunit SecE